MTSSMATKHSSVEIGRVGSTLKVVEPQKREAGVRVDDVAQLVDKLKNEV